MTAGQGLEYALSVTEDEVDSALKAAAAATRELRKAKSAAVKGQVRDLRRSLEAAAASAQESGRAATGAEASFTFDEKSTSSPEALCRSSSRWPRLGRDDAGTRPTAALLPLARLGLC